MCTAHSLCFVLRLLSTLIHIGCLIKLSIWLFIQGTTSSVLRNFGLHVSSSPVVLFWSMLDDPGRCADATILVLEQAIRTLFGPLYKARSNPILRRIALQQFHSPSSRFAGSFRVAVFSIEQTSSATGPMGKPSCPGRFFSLILIPISKH